MLVKFAHAEANAFVADIDTGTADDTTDLRSLLAAERAPEQRWTCLSESPRPAHVSLAVGMPAILSG